MNKKRALITGINGQDGSILADVLLNNDYEIFGIVRRHSVSSGQTTRLEHLLDNPNIHLEYGDLLDNTSIEKIIQLSKPDEIYSLASQSHVKISSDLPIYTTQVNCIGLVNLLEAYRKYASNAKFIQASSSEMFGKSCNKNGFQNEDTPMHPCSPYGCTKLFGFHMVKHYRNAYKLFACNSICFNHEGSRRGENFVTQKIAKGAVEIKLGLKEKLYLGNLKSSRDWSDARDLVRGIYMIINHTIPDDFVISSMETHMVQEFCELSFNYLDLNWKNYVEIDPKFYRAEELKYLKGDSTKIRKQLGWKPQFNFNQLVESMVHHWMVKLKK